MSLTWAPIAPCRGAPSGPVLRVKLPRSVALATAIYRPLAPRLCAFCAPFVRLGRCNHPASVVSRIKLVRLRMYAFCRLSTTRPAQVAAVSGAWGFSDRAIASGSRMGVPWATVNEAVRVLLPTPFGPAITVRMGGDPLTQKAHAEPRAFRLHRRDTRSGGHRVCA